MLIQSATTAVQHPDNGKKTSESILDFEAHIATPLGIDAVKAGVFGIVGVGGGVTGIR
jgi:hypothetical protein